MRRVKVTYMWWSSCNSPSLNSDKTVLREELSIHGKRDWRVSDTRYLIQECQIYVYISSGASHKAQHHSTRLKGPQKPTINYIKDHVTETPDTSEDSGHYIEMASIKLSRRHMSPAE